MRLGCEKTLKPIADTASASRTPSSSTTCGTCSRPVSPLRSCKHTHTPANNSLGDTLFDPKRAQAFRLLCVHNGREILQRDPNELKTGADLLLTRGPRNPFVIDYFGIDFDGEVLGPISSQYLIEPFDGEKKIAELSLFPMEYAKKPAGASANRITTSLTLNPSLSLRDALVERGSRFRKLANAKHMAHCEYRGMTIAYEDIDPELVGDGKTCGVVSVLTAPKVDSRVIVDLSYYYEQYSLRRPILGLVMLPKDDDRELAENTFLHGKPERRPYTGAGPGTYDYFYDDRRVEEERVKAFVNENRSWLADVGRKDNFSDEEQLILMPGTINAFVLHSRLWRESRNDAYSAKEGSRLTCAQSCWT